MCKREGGGGKATRCGAQPVKVGSLLAGLCRCSETGTAESEASCRDSALHCLVSLQKLYWREKRGKKTLHLTLNPGTAEGSFLSQKVVVKS